MRKNQKSVSFYLSKEEKAALDKVRGKMTYREYVLRGTVDPRPKGRPSLDVAIKDLEAQYKQRVEDRQKVIHDKLVKANKRGLSEEVKRRMYGDAEWYKVMCINCKHKYQTSLLMSTCPVCSQVNRYRLPPTELPLGEPVFLNQPLTETEVEGFEEKRTGNLSEGYTPATWPGHLRTGGTASNPKPSVVGWDESRFKYGKKKKKAR